MKTAPPPVSSPPLTPSSHCRDNSVPLSSPPVFCPTSVQPFIPPSSVSSSSAFLPSSFSSHSTPDNLGILPLILCNFLSLPTLCHISLPSDPLPLRSGHFSTGADGKLSVRRRAGRGSGRRNEELLCPSPCSLHDAGVGG